MLLAHGAINEQNERINKDELKVYCTGDLVDGGVNRMGDLLLLEYAEEWFDAIVIGNHELPFMGGPRFLGLRAHDRELSRKLLELEYKGIYVPAAVVEDYLLVHAGLAERWGFYSAQDACDAIRIAWDTSMEDTKEIPILDWISVARSGKYGDETGGVFWLDWTDNRNSKINQIVGHSTYVHGPLVQFYNTGREDAKREHWNIDVGGKYGYCLGGVIVEKGQPTIPVFWGDRVQIHTQMPTPQESPSGEGDSDEGRDFDDLTEAEWQAIMEMN